MAGLFDLMNSDQGLLGLSLLAAGAPRERRTSVGEGLLQGLQNVRAQRMQEEDRRAKAEAQALQARLLNAQIGETEAQAAQRRDAQAQAVRARELEDQFRALIQSPQSAAASAALSGGGGPTVDNAAKMGAVDQNQQLMFEAMRLGQMKPMDYIAASMKAQPQPLKVGAGEALVDPKTLKPLFTNPKEDSTPSDWKLYQLSGAPERGIGFDQWDQARRRAGATNIGMPKIEVKTGESIAQQIGPMMKESKSQADAGLRLVDSASRVLDAAERGNLYAGPMANLKLKTAQVADAFGVAGKDTQEKIANTRNVVRGMAEQAVSARAQLGGQAQISNSEQELLNKATSGDIGELTAREIVQIANLNDRLGRQMYGNHQRQMQVMQQRPDLQGVAPFYSVPDLPKPRGGQVVRTGRDAQGRKVEQLSDGSIRYAD